MSSATRRPHAAGREVAVTFDDLPVISVVHGDVESHRRITQRLLDGLSTHGIPATGFVNAAAVEPAGRIESARVALLRHWLDAGHELANHTFGHSDLHHVRVEAFEADIVRGEPLVRELMAARGREPRWFRHPYLHTGASPEEKRWIERFLADRGCRVAPVTVLAEDQLFAAALDRARARGDQRAAAGVTSAYVPHFGSRFDYFERISRRLLGREIPQVLLLHANTINAERIGALAEMLRRRAYTFVPLERALADPAYAEPDEYFGAKSLGMLQRMALRCGRADWLVGEPTTPRFVLEGAEPGQLERLRRSAKAVLRAAGVLSPKRLPAA
jgi:peptidoglycan/xylan/chitin deacetylase (PgdA/CDA1 family)